MYVCPLSASGERREVSNIANGLNRNTQCQEVNQERGPTFFTQEYVQVANSTSRICCAASAGDECLLVDVGLGIVRVLIAYKLSG